MIRNPWPRLVLGILILALASRPGIAQEVAWRQDYNAARREAAETGRPLLIDFGTANCYWCRQLEKTTFREPAVARVMNDRFIPLHINGDQDYLLAQALGIEAYPTLILAAPNGKILDRIEGYVDATGFATHLQAALTAMERAVKTPPLAQRVGQARELLTQAREAFRAKDYLRCLDHCELLVIQYGDLPEARDARQLFDEVRNNPEWLRQASESLSDRLAELYLSLAEAWLQKGQPQQAAIYLQRVIQQFPGSRHAKAAQARLAQLHSKSTP